MTDFNSPFMYGDFLLQCLSLPLNEWSVGCMCVPNEYVVRLTVSNLKVFIHTSFLQVQMRGVLWGATLIHLESRVSVESIPSGRLY